MTTEPRPATLCPRCAGRMFKDADGESYRSLSRLYAVDPRAIERAVKGQTWSHVS